jgi:hypothetical protein
MLLPNGGYVAYGEDYEGIEFLECAPISKAQFQAGFAAYDSWKLEQDNIKAAAKTSAQAKLEALGLTSDDLKALNL